MPAVAELALALPVKGMCFGLAACLAGTPPGVVQERELVVQAWILESRRLYPADCDAMPADALADFPRY